MAALNFGLLLLVTVVITGTGNVIYQNSIEEKFLCKHNGNSESGIEGSGSDFSSLFLIMWQPWALRRNFRNI